MATTENARSVYLAAANPRLLTSPNSALIITASSPVFHVDTGGSPDVTQITFNVISVAIEGGATYNFSCVGGTLTNIAGNTAALTYANMTGDTATISVSVTYRNNTYTASTKVSKLFDVTAGATGLNNALMYAYQRSSTQPVGTPGEVQYSFTAAGITTGVLANGWLKAIPNGTDPLWVTAASASSSSATDTVGTNEWSTPVVLAQNGLDGVSPALMSLSSTAQSFTYNSTGAETPASQTITFTANLINTTGTATFTCTKYNAAGTSIGTVTLGGTGNTRTLSIAQFTTSAFRAVVTATLGGLSDTITIVRLADGAAGAGVSAIAGYLTNESVTVPSGSDGSSPVLTGVTGNFKVFQGTTDITSGCTFSIVGTPLVTVSAPTAATGAYSVTGAGTWSNASLTTSVTFRASHTASGATIDQVLTLTKAPAGLNGTSPAILTLASTAQAFTYNGTGVATPASQTISFTANLQNTTGTATFSCTKYDSAGASLGTVTLGGTGNTRTLTDTQFTTAAFRAVVTATLNGLSDTITVVRLADGAAGSGVSALAGYLTNEAVNVPTAPDGSGAVLTGVNGNFRVFQGTTDVTAGCTFSVVGTPLVTTTAPVSATGYYSVTGVGTWANSSLTTSVTYRALHTASGATIDQVLTITKALAGVQGGNGINSAILTVYRRTTTNAAPVKPSAATTYTFSPPSLTGLNNSWTTTIPAASGGAYLWATTATAASTTATDSIAASEWATPQLLASDGLKGDTGSRGNVQVARAIPGSVWSDSEAVLAISGAGYGTPIVRDVVTLYNNASGFSQAKYYDGTAWQILAAYFNGGLIVDGTVLANKIDARGLDIKDVGGNVILRAGISLAEQTKANPNLVPRISSWPIGSRYNSSLFTNTNDPLPLNGEYINLPDGPGPYIGYETAPVGIPQNAYYTVSFDAFAYGTRTLNVDLYSSSANDSFGIAVTLDGTVRRYSFTERMTHAEAPQARLRVFAGTNQNGNAYVTNIKVELGMKATAYCDTVITPSDVAQKIMPNAITNTQFGGDLFSTDWNGIVGPGGAGWMLQRSGNFYGNSISLRGAVMGGAYTSFSSPTAGGGTGFFLGPQGLTLGNYNDGRYVTLYANGDIEAPGFSLVNKQLTLSNSVIVNPTISGPKITTTFSVSIPGANYGNVANNTNFDLGLFPVTPSGGVAPYTYQFTFNKDDGGGAMTMYGNTSSDRVGIKASGASNTVQGYLSVTVIDANNSIARATSLIRVTFGAGAQ